MSKSQFAQGSTQYIAGCRLAVDTVEKARSGGDVRVPPAIEDNACDVAAGIKAGSTEELHHLLADLCFVVPEARLEHSLTGDSALIRERVAAFVERNIEGQQER